jgi:hypothetical protein
MIFNQVKNGIIDTDIAMQKTKLMLEHISE